MNVKIIAIFFALLFTAATANDQQYWIDKAVEYAKKDKNQWSQAMVSLESNNDTRLLEIQITFLQSLVADSVNNMNKFVPRLIRIVNIINRTAAGEPNIIRRATLHAILWFIRGKRDNKSYYLLDGAVNWLSNRVSELQLKGKRGAALASKLTDVQISLANLRDKLDSEAHNFVKGLTKIDTLSEDIAKNIVEIRAVANQTLSDLQKSTLLQHAAAVNNVVAHITV